LITERVRRFSTFDPFVRGFYREGGLSTGNTNSIAQMEVRGMNYQIRDKRPPTKEEREAKKEQSRKDAERVLAARKKADDAFRANFERLKAERLARQAAGKS
jgi:hypothetical protein